MNENIKGLIKLILSILIYYVLNIFYFKLLGLVGLHFTGDAYTIANFIKYLIMALIVGILYHGDINLSIHKYHKTILTSLIFTVGTVVLLVFLNVVLHKLISSLGGMTTGYGFTNYFQNTLTLSSALEIIEQCIIIPFLVVVIFSLGVSKVIRNINAYSIISAILYGLLLGLTLNTTFYVALMSVIVPSVIILLLTYIYKANSSIWMCIISYILYITFGAFIVGYVL